MKRVVCTMENLICIKCEDEFLVRPGGEEWQRRTCTSCLDEQMEADPRAFIKGGIV